MKYLLIGLTDDNAAFRHVVDTQGNITEDAAAEDTSEKTDKADNNDHDTDSEMTTSEDTTTGNNNPI